MQRWPSGNVCGDGGVNSCLVILKQPYGSEQTGHLPDGLESTHSACNPVFGFLTAECMSYCLSFSFFIKTVGLEMIHSERDLFSSVAFFAKKG